MKCLPLLASLLVSLSASAAPASQPPADGEGPPVIPPLEPLEPLREAAYPATAHFVLGLAGPIAQKIYYFYAPHEEFDLSYPYAPLSRIEATHAEGLACYRRIPKFGDEQFRCNIAFHPARPQGEWRYVPPYTYGLVPHFVDQALTRVSLILQKDGETQARYLLQSVACPRLAPWDFSVSAWPCAYQVQHDQVNDVYFPGDINPQGVAFGWGVVQD